MSKSGWGERIKTRARELGLTDVAVARALDLTQRRYSAYVNESREPPFTMLMAICGVLRTSPDAVLGYKPQASLAVEDAAAARLDALVRGMSEPDRARTLTVVEALAAHPTMVGATVTPRGIRKPNTGANSRRRGAAPP